MFNYYTIILTIFVENVVIKKWYYNYSNFVESIFLEYNTPLCIHKIG
jgi:hypothetical protein